MRAFRVAACAALALIVACDRSSDGATPPPPGGLTLLVAQAPAAPDATCPHGGTAVSAGLDTDHDGVLDPEEVAKVETVCDPEPATTAVLTRVDPEPPGTRCPAGGTRVDAGRDLDRDGVLATGEVEQTAFACGAPAPDAPPVLTRVDPEPAGTRCAAGGSAVRLGPDRNRSGTLEDGEITDVRYLCETRALRGFTVRSKADADIVSAAEVVDGFLDVQIADPIDVDLSPAVVTLGITVRSGLKGLGIYGWFVGGDIRVEGNGTLERLWIDTRATLGGDVVVQDNPRLTSLDLPSGRLNTLEPFRYPGNLVVARNARLESFGWLEPVEVSGSVVVESNPALRLLFLDGLARIGGDLVLVQDGALTDLGRDTTKALTSIGGVLHIRDNAKLERFFFSALRSTGGLRVERNPALIDPRLPSLAAVLGDVSVVENDALVGVTDLSMVGVVSGSVSVLRNRNLMSLRGFDDLVRIAGSLTVSANPELRELGFGRLFQADAVTLSDNPALEVIGPIVGDLPYVPSLTRLEKVRELRVTSNAALRQLMLPSLRTGAVVTVSGSPHLPTCQAAAIPAWDRYVSGTDDAAICP